MQFLHLLFKFQKTIYCLNIYHDDISTYAPYCVLSLFFLYIFFLVHLSLFLSLSYHGNWILTVYRTNEKQNGTNDEYSHNIFQTYLAHTKNKDISPAGGVLVNV